MRGILVALDLETTGLDANSDKIIEFGAVRMKEGEIIEEYATLVNPGIPIPDRTTLLTGIKPQDVVGAPPIGDVLAQIEAFVGDAPIIGHSVAFDLSFLRKHGLFADNLSLDTYDMASVLIPEAPRYNLHHLTQMLDIRLEDAHRALDDARASGILYWELYQKALTLPLQTLKTIYDASQGLNWAAAGAFKAAYEEVAVLSNSDVHTSTLPASANSYISDTYSPLRPNETLQPLETERIMSWFEQGGKLSQAITTFEHREEQIDMVNTVSNAFNEGEQVIIEAGTGIGKSLAYLVPAIEWALKNNTRVLISTDTIALQDQLLHKDIPLVRQIFDRDFSAVVMKGRANYLCPLQVELLRRRGPTTVEELRVFAKIIVWQLKSATGDKSEITLRGPAEQSIWHRLSSAEGLGCRENACKNELGIDCPFARAYNHAEAAHVVVVNHALLISNATLEGQILPEYDHLIVDEAHHLEDAMTNILTFSLDEATLQRRLEDIGNERRGLLSDIITSVKKSDLPDKRVKRIIAYTADITKAVHEMQSHVKHFFNAIGQTAQQIDKGSWREFVTHVRIEEKHRTDSQFAALQEKWALLSEFIEVITGAISDLRDTLSKLNQYHIVNYSDLMRSSNVATSYLNNIQAQLNQFILQPDENTIYWLTLSQDNQRITLQTAPLHVGDLTQKYLWDKCRTVILTSATLRTNGSFDYIRERLNIDGAISHEIGSPFNYQEAALLYLPTDIPEPSDMRRYQQAVEQSILALAGAMHGRIMVLFTSYSQLRQTSKAVTARLALADIAVFDQSDGTSKNALIEGFKSSEKAVLLATRSFWEGVDIPGDDLSGLIITRLPFAVPSDPIFAARSDTYTNSFNDYAIPEAVLRFRQGFGRLIRTQKDRGVVVVMDKRIITKRYGTTFLDALPNCTVEKSSIKNLAATAKSWIDKE